jgi:ubiquinone/menaquinone biosynthesis C-methylase UbiE
MIQTEVGFATGPNWACLSNACTQERINRAEGVLRCLFPNGELTGKDSLEIGCGLGFSMLAALRLGAAMVYGIDNDIDAVRGAIVLLSRQASPHQWSVTQRSVIGLGDDRFSIIYSSRGLHLEEDAKRALEFATKALKPEGLMALTFPRTGALKRIAARRELRSLGLRTAHSFKDRSRGIGGIVLQRPLALAAMNSSLSERIATT